MVGGGGGEGGGGQLLCLHSFQRPFSNALREAQPPLPGEGPDTSLISWNHNIPFELLAQTLILFPKRSTRHGLYIPKKRPHSSQ